MRGLRRQSGHAVMADESVQTLTDAWRVARAEAADVWNVYMTEAGGLMAAMNIFAFAAALHIPCIIGSQGEMGIGAAANAHLGAAAPNLPYACEMRGFLRYQRDIVRHSPRIEAGYIYPPDAPGLGVEIDEDALRDMRQEL